MSNGGRQFDPVASAATSALDTTQRGLRNFQSNMNAPELPAQSQSFSGLRSVLSSVSQFSPANVLANGELPTPGQGQQGLGNLPSPNQLLPGAGGSGQGLPSPNQLLPGMGGSGQAGFDVPRPPMQNGSGSSGSSNGGRGNAESRNGSGAPSARSR